MTIPVFYVPLLHRECVPERMRDWVVCVPCGLPEPSTPRNERTDPGAREAVRRALPLGPAESRAILKELLGLGEEHASSGVLRQVSALRRMEEESHEAMDEEMADLKDFSASGRVLPLSVRRNSPDRNAEKKHPSPEESSLRRILVNSQKVLLLTHALEERMLEAARLESRFSRAEESLYAALGEGDAEDLSEFGRQDAPQSGDDGGDPLTLPAPWRLVTEAMFPFLPDKSALFTADTGMVRDLLASDLLRTFPDDRACLLSGWPEEFTAGLLYARLPAWRLTGRRALPAELPWLNKEYEVLALKPTGGFSA